ncbi:hypothetical protein RyT2_07880 [Pseudolactococcus yaeyamensis]
MKKNRNIDRRIKKVESGNSARKGTTAPQNKITPTEKTMIQSAKAIEDFTIRIINFMTYLSFEIKQKREVLLNSSLDMLTQLLIPRR